MKSKSRIRYLASKHNPISTITHSFRGPSDSTLVSTSWPTGFTQGGAMSVCIQTLHLVAVRCLSRLRGTEAGAIAEKACLSR